MEQEKTPEPPKRAIPWNVLLYILSLLLVSVPIMFWDVRVGCVVGGGLLWLDFFLSSVLEQLGDFFRPRFPVTKRKGARDDGSR